MGHTHRVSLVLLSAAAVFAGAVPALAQSPAASDAAPAMSMADLEAAAKEEGELTVIALPRNWCNYGAAIDGFKKKYGLIVNELNPDAGSGQEIEAIKANQGTTGPGVPDVIDVGLAFGPSAKEEGLLQPYKVSTWDTIPDAAKDPDGYWYGDYYGVLAFETNTGVQPNPPADWADLLKPEYAGQVALAGDPRQSNEAIQSVYAAALANGGSLDDAAPGLAFWKQVVDAGNFVPAIANATTIGQGETPVTVEWSYLALANRDASAAAGGPEIAITIPASGPFAGTYVQAISAYAPHPNAAKLWMEYLYSDEGQNHWLSGYCYPIRFDDLAARDAIPADVLAKLPDVSGAIFPSLEQLNAAKTLITEGWDTVVGVDVK